MAARWNEKGLASVQYLVEQGIDVAAETTNEV